MPGAAATVAVVLAALLAGPWLALVIERVGVVASGPVAGEPVLAWAGEPGLAWAGTTGSALPHDPVRGRRNVRPAAGPVGVGVAAAATGGVLAWSVGSTPVLPALVLLAGLGMVLAPVDVRTHRLPDALVLPAYPVLSAVLLLGVLAPAARTAVRDPTAWSQALSGGLTLWARAAEGGLVAFGVMYLLAVAVPTGFGFGDVKLTGLLGAALAWYGWPMLLRGLLAGFLLGGLCASALLVTRRADRHASLAFGPFLLAGALVALCTPG